MGLRIEGDERWTARAACDGMDQGDFFSIRGPSHNRDNEKRLPGKAVCWTLCQVRDECLVKAMRSRTRHGIWGGRTSLERQRMEGVVLYELACDVCGIDFPSVYTEEPCPKCRRSARLRGLSEIGSPTFGGYN